jgi:transcriptional regulator with XRE-family HTH domain
LLTILAPFGYSLFNLWLILSQAKKFTSGYFFLDPGTFVDIILGGNKELRDMEIKPVIIGERIRDKRSERGLSQKALAEMVGISPPAINRFEKGIKAPSIDTLAKLAKALGVSADFLLGSGADDEIFVDDEVKDAFKEFKQLSPENRQHILQNIHFLKAR